jgi:hypothetical protein
VQTTKYSFGYVIFRTGALVKTASIAESSFHILLFIENSSPSIPIRESYDPKGNMFIYSLVLSPFMSTGHDLTKSTTFLLAPVASYTRQDFPCLLLGN